MNGRKLFSSIYKIVSALMLTLLISCAKNGGKKVTSKLELRQLVQETKSEKKTSGYYFLIGGEYKSSETKNTVIKVFAKVNGRYRLIQMPIDEIRINIDDKVTTPNIQIEYICYSELTEDELISRDLITKVYVINCPEQYLPEKLLPIEL